MPVQFNQIPNLLLTPGVFIEYDNSQANQGLPPLPNRVLLIGSLLAAGSAASGELKQILRADDGISFFGARSQLAWMCDKFKRASRFTEVWAIGLSDDGAGVAATKTITITGTATSAGVLHFLVHGIRVPVAVAVGDDQDAVAASVDAAMTAEPRLMYTSGAALGVATLTCVHAAALGNDLDVRLNYFPREELDAPAGITVAIADDVSGAADPDVADAIAAVGAEYFTKWVVGWNDAATILAVETELDVRWGPTVQQDAIAYYGLRGTFAEMTAISDARNSQFTVLVDGGGVVAGPPAPPWEIAAATAAVDSNEPDPGRPRQTLPVPNILPPAREDRFTLDERNLLLQSGIATFTIDGGGRVLIERLVTTYKENAQALPDTSYQNVCSMHLLAALRYTTRARFSQKYPRHKLADDGTNYGPGQAVMTPSVARGELLTLFEQWELNAWVEDFEQFAEELIVERNGSDVDRLDALLGPNLINQFRVFAAQIQFRS